MSRKYYIYFIKFGDNGDCITLNICPKDFWDENKYIPDYYILEEDLKDEGTYKKGDKTDDAILNELERLGIEEVGDWDFEIYADEDKTIEELYEKLLDSGICEFSQIFLDEFQAKFPNRGDIYLPK